LNFSVWIHGIGSWQCLPVANVSCQFSVSVADR
jgi:hypothetical protein